MLNFVKPISVWAVAAGTPEERSHSASGGLCTALGRAFIKEKHGVVVGVRWDENFSAVFDFAYTFDQLEDFRGSKYVYSKLTVETLSAISLKIEDGIPILFFGLPCQVAIIKEKFGSLVYTVDIICHGTMSGEHLKAELDYLGLKKIYGLSFRSNCEPDYHMRVGHFSGIYDKPALKQPYYYGFLNCIGLRPGCYCCRYAQPKRISDLTVGDFIHLGYPYLKEGKQKCVLAPNWDGNISFCSVNSSYGENLLQMLGDSIRKEMRDYEERLSYGPSLLHPCSRPFEDRMFRQLLGVLGFPMAIRIAGAHHKVRKSILQIYVGIKRSIGINGPLFRR